MVRKNLWGKIRYNFSYFPDHFGGGEGGGINTVFFIPSLISDDVFIL